MSTKLGLRTFFTSTTKALILSVPLLLATYFSIWLTQKRDQAIESSIYSVSATETNYNCRAVEEKLFCKQAGLKTDSKNTVEFIFVEMEKSLSERVSLRLDSLEGGAEMGSEAIIAALFTDPNSAVPSPEEIKTNYFNPPRCKWYYWLGYKVGDCIKNKIFNAINDAYYKMWSGLKADLESYLATLDTQLENSSNRIEGRVDEFLNEKTNEYKLNIFSTIDYTFLTLLALTVAVYILIFSGLIKSFLYIWARLLYNEDHAKGLLTRSQISHENVHTITAEDITEKGERYYFCQSTKEKNWYTSFNRHVDPERHGHISFAKITQLFLRRLLAGKLLLEKYLISDKPIKADANNSFRFVRIDLKQDDEVYFRVSDLIAFSEDVTFITSIDIKLASMLKLRWIFPVARGPGSIILMGRGGTLQIIDHKDDAGIAPHQILAFDMNGSFPVHARNSFLGTYLLRHTLVPNEGTLAIRHKPDNTKNLPARVLRRIFFFLTPT